MLWKVIDHNDGKIFIIDFDCKGKKFYIEKLVTQ